MSTRNADKSTAKSPAPSAAEQDAAARPTRPVGKPTVVAESMPVVSEPALKKQELLAQVVEQSGIKKKYAKPVVEAMLDVLGESLEQGRELNLQPFGKLKHNRTKETANARIHVTKIRQNKSAAPAQNRVKDTVADAAE
ncbi:MAG: HU family DNA-binding protein [Roseovarius sp.]|nr:HU family DNA-binding protein [Roseovarius sp.]